MTSKERAALRAQANTIDTTLMVGKGGVSETLVAEAEKLLDIHELVKGRVLETAMMTPREVCDALCEATGAEGIQVVGSKFVIWRKSEKVEQEKKAEKKAATPKKVSGNYNPVKAGITRRKQQAKERRKQQKEYFHEAAVKAAIERRKQQEEQKGQESESAPAWEDEDAEYYELHHAIRDDLSYQVELEKVQLNGENDQEENLYVITGEKPVIQGENNENLDVLNDALTAEYQDLQEYMEMITGDLGIDGAEPVQVSVDCYVTYMDEEFLSVVYNVRISMEYYGQVYLSCVNINMESGVVMHNLMDLIHVDDAFAIEFRERNARQNQTDSIDYMSDQEVAAYLCGENTGIAYFTPLGMEIGFNYELGWITVTYQDYRDYLRSL